MGDIEELERENGGYMWFKYLVYMCAITKIKFKNDFKDKSSANSLPQNHTNIKNSNQWF